jgi:hypothetical protein
VAFDYPSRGEWFAEVQRLYAERGGNLDITNPRYRWFWDEQYVIRPDKPPWADFAVEQFMRSHPNALPSE